MTPDLMQAGAERKAIAGAFDTALTRLEADASLSRADRLGALTSRVALARIDQPARNAPPMMRR